MCGRYTLSASASKLSDRFGATVTSTITDSLPRYNCAPGQTLPVITNENPNQFQQLKWGLIPSWADDDTGGQINARAETVDEKPTFATAYESQRCLVPADGFYEWVRDDTDSETGAGDNTKQPYRVTFSDDRTFAMAGLWERWEPTHTQTGLSDFGAGDADDMTDSEAGQQATESFTIITTEPNDVVSSLHHRMAVVLPPEAESVWLHGDADTVESLLTPHTGDQWETYPVSTRVNSPANDESSLIDPV
ncbi:SOS response-associated peptidase [Haloquadratum walsbyi]|jgi:Uncharacterized conserved protein|uniref:SOS response-associated peptidase YedK n=1 Tax=Haloquadratum walsbyi J07HQW2 TaxID=1238425 RepID=U1NCZ3_9EURY|nr:SOS response-associated peptidase [Haloquadratum walsbyi]ERG94810.1 MAG: hypothetical protein J07HQW2_01252 [Haloquadratum walsbyi J07HQW2]